ncbi:LSM domain [Trypanosoma melophagium]|uniref:LSM domain n=1 Tax=Trypanosoma melophagium TaxID=715481 RepID=UPI00351A7E14|nr:LSM domain [Trypanosoma melophagium]
MSAQITPQQGPLPAVVIQQALMQQQQQQEPSTLPVLFRVEVETRQGYVYEGKLMALDDDYNINLAEATCRRERLCDVERALLQAKGFPTPLVSPATRRRYMGSVFIRSSNLFMLRFQQGEEPTLPSSSYANITTGNSSHSCSTSAGNGAATLRSAFKSMASKVKRQINMERQKNRVERRQRKHLAIKTSQKGAIKDGGGKLSSVKEKVKSKKTGKTQSAVS